MAGEPQRPVRLQIFPPMGTQAPRRRPRLAPRTRTRTPAQAIRNSGSRTARRRGSTISDPGRIQVIDAGQLATIESWLDGQPTLGASIVFDDPRPRRGTAQSFAVAGRDGRVVAALGNEAADGLRRLVESRDIPLVGHEVKPVLVA